MVSVGGRRSYKESKVKTRTLKSTRDAAPRFVLPPLSLSHPPVIGVVCGRARLRARRDMVFSVVHQRVVAVVSHVARGVVRIPCAVDNRSLPAPKLRLGDSLGTDRLFIRHRNLKWLRQCICCVCLLPALRKELLQEGSCLLFSFEIVDSKSKFAF